MWSHDGRELPAERVLHDGRDMPAALVKRASFYLGPGASQRVEALAADPDDQPAGFSLESCLDATAALQCVAKFPSTPHLFDAASWLGGPGALGQGDTLLKEPTARARFLGGELARAEEKLDGANLAVFFEPGNGKCPGHGLPRPSYKNRGKSVCSTSSAQYGGSAGKGLDAWMDVRHCTLWRLLGWRYMLFGEWCYLVHSVRYTGLPDYFVAFDVYDRVEGKYLSADRREAMLAGSGIATVPHIATDRWSEHSIRELIYGESGAGARCSACNLGVPVEGVYLRVDRDGWLESRAKVVRHDFIQGIEDNGRWERQKPVFQLRETSGWGWFNGTRCCGTSDVFHAPPELEPGYSPELDGSPAEAEGVELEQPEPAAPAAAEDTEVRVSRKGKRAGPGWKLLILVGVQGCAGAKSGGRARGRCGKSSFADALCQAHGGWVRVCQDEDDGSRYLTERHLGTAARQGHPMVLDRCNFSASDRKEWMKVAMVTPRETAVVFFDFPPELCKLRVMMRRAHPTIPFGAAQSGWV